MTQALQYVQYIRSMTEKCINYKLNTKWLDDWLNSFFFYHIKFY